jgi:Rps23 Pro-64 3,4-dihydroxylase Tpa1-like proline 4-hydroxylase
MTPKFAIVENVFPEEAFSTLDRYSQNLLDSEDTPFTTNQGWHQAIRSERGTVLCHRITEKDEQLIPLIAESMKRYTDQENLLIESVYFYYWLTDSYIPWHDDYGHDASMSVYFNDQWNPDHGGLWLTTNDDGTYLGIKPERNLGIYQRGGVQHCTTPVTKVDVVRRTMQIWLAEK